MIRIRHHAFRNGAAAALLAVTLLGTSAFGTEAIPAGQTVVTFADRLFLNPPSQAVVAGYFCAIQGLPGPLFAAAPGEASAFFTWTLNASGAQLVTNGDTSVALLNENENLYVYFNPTPNHSWSDPNSFAKGDLIAILRSSPGTSTSSGPNSQVVQSYTLVYSKPFQFRGKTYDFGDLVPNGFTFVSFGSNIPQPPAGGYPLVFTGAGSGMAMGGKSSGH